jgi:uncharacterized protein (DUF2141 family)
VRHRSRPAGTLIVLAGLALAGNAPPPQDVSVVASGLRNGKGRLLACLTAQPTAFPECGRDPAARKLAVPLAGSGPVTLDFGPVPPGRYAVSLIHDENANGKLDTALMIPREGFGFSRDAPVRFGPPRFDAAAFEVGAEPVRLPVRLRYLLGGRAAR